MRDLDRNKQLIYYSLYTGYTAMTDDWGNETGENAPTYADPVPLYINVSPAVGEDIIAAFGINSEYRKTLVTTDLDCPIQNDTVLWIGKNPTTDPFNFRVSSVQKGLNSIRYLVVEINTTLPEEP